MTTKTTIENIIQQKKFKGCKLAYDMVDSDSTRFTSFLLASSYIFF